MMIGVRNSTDVPKDNLIWNYKLNWVKGTVAVSTIPTIVLYTAENYCGAIRVAMCLKVF